MAEPLPDLLTIDEAADYLRTPKATLYAWRYEGRGPTAIKLGRRLVYRRSDLLAFLDKHTAA